MKCSAPMFLLMVEAPLIWNANYKGQYHDTVFSSDAERQTLFLIETQSGDIYYWPLHPQRNMDKIP